jgi:fermentation-respiration switch protein FrsA (DUF1100 family)
MTYPQLRPTSFYLKFLAITIIVTVLGLIVVSAALMASAVTLPLKSRVCCETPAHFGADFETMRFTTADGLTLSGWYIPPKNGAVIILIHSYYSDRRQTLPVAEMLYKHGYGLLTYDQRASGESDGSTRSLGTLDVPDVYEAIRWLITRQKNLKIGAYGCSMGAAIAIGGAVNAPEIRALAVDAPSQLLWNENLPQFSPRDPFSRPIIALYYQFILLRVQALPVTSTDEAVKNYGGRPILFISTGQSGELSAMNAYFKAALGPKEYWNIPDAKHCDGPNSHPEEYQQHLVNFFNSALR